MGGTSSVGAWRSHAERLEHEVHRRPREERDDQMTEPLEDHEDDDRGPAERQDHAGARHRVEDPRDVDERPSPQVLGSSHDVDVDRQRDPVGHGRREHHTHDHDHDGGPDGQGPPGGVRQRGRLSRRPPQPVTSHGNAGEGDLRSTIAFHVHAWSPPGRPDPGGPR